MNSNNSKLTRRLLAAALCGAGLWAGTAAAGDYGARIERQLDHKGDRIERRLDRRAERLRDEARRLERKGDRIDRRLDRKGERLHRRWHQQHAHRHGHHKHRDHRDYRPVYVYQPVPHHRYYPREPGVTLSIDLGPWVIRP